VRLHLADLRRALPVLASLPCRDDTGFPKQGWASVGVQRQYCGALGKIGSCQVAVSTALIPGGMAWPTSLELYLPRVWLDDEGRRTALNRIPRALIFPNNGASRSRMCGRCSKRAVARTGLL